MKAFGSFRFCVPLLGLGIFLVLAPQSRAQQEVSPDHFDDIVGAASTKAPAKAKQPAAPVAQTQSNKSSATGSQVNAAKKPTTAQQPELVAVTDKRKTPARKPNNP